MRHSIILAALLSAAPALAEQEITVERTGSKVLVSSATSVADTSASWPLTTVKVRATFPNPCAVPSADELFRVITHSPDYATLEITLVSVVDRICTLQYEPTTVTLNLGSYSNPQDGNFTRIVVNGVRAIAAQ